MTLSTNNLSSNDDPSSHMNVCTCRLRLSILSDTIQNMHVSHWTPIIVKISSSRCRFCNAWRFIGESTTFCCLSGKYVVPPLRPYPVEFECVLNYRYLSQISRRLNYLFTVSSIGVTDGVMNSGSFYNQNGACYFGAHGRTYHRILPGNQCGEHPLRWFLYDDLESQSNTAIQHSIPQQLVDAVCVSLF